MPTDPKDTDGSKPTIIHLGTMQIGGKGPGPFVSGVVKLWADPEADLLSAAKNFLKAADRCLNGCVEEEGVEMLTVPGAVCAALSSELFLKYVVLKESGGQPKGHKLKELFTQCAQETQRALIDRRSDIVEVLERNSNHFVDARYHHESEIFSFRQQELLQIAELLGAFVEERFGGTTV